MMQTPLTNVIEMVSISKSFDGIVALNNASLTVKNGTIHAILGENGAGKSTLMNILGGVIKSDSGSVKILGVNYDKLTPKKCMELGIEFVHQELNLIEDITIYENIFLGREVLKSGFLNKKKMILESQEVMKKLGININVEIGISELGASDRQIVEIAKALYSNPKIMILDEPTAALTGHEIENLFQVLKTLKSIGVTIIYISHKMPEIFAVCDDYTVLRDGEYIGCGKICDVDTDELVAMMVGEQIDIHGTKDVSYVENDVVFRAVNLSLNDIFDDINFSLKRGEVLSLTGVQSDGRLEILETIFGKRGCSSGYIQVGEKKIERTNINTSIKNGIGYVASNRKENSIIPDLSILSNFKISDMKNTKGLFYKRKIYNQEISEFVDLLSIKYASSENLITSLSGGNQQKIILSRILKTRPKILILDNPTQGIDIKSKEEVYNIIQLLAKSGLSIIISTSEVPEIIKTSDRCLVLYNRKIVKELDACQINETVIMEYATGMKESDYLAR